MAQSYSNPGGSGNRFAKLDLYGTATMASGAGYALIDGSQANTTFFGSGQTLREFRFDFREPRLIDEAKWYQDSSGSHGTWKWQGSNDGSSWTDIGGTFTLGGTTTQTQTTLNGNVTAYRYYRLLQTAGSTSNGPYTREIEFRIDDATQRAQGFWLGTLGSGNRTGLITVTTTATMGTGTTIDKLVDGNYGNTSGGGGCYLAGAESGREIKFDFGTAKLIVGAQWIQDQSASQGTWKWQGSNDNSSWTDIGGTFNLGVGNAAYGRMAQRLAEIEGNANAYRYYRLLQTAGTTSITPWLHEIQFAQDTAPTPPARRRQAVVC